MFVSGRSLSFVADVLMVGFDVPYEGCKRFGRSGADILGDYFAFESWHLPTMAKPWKVPRWTAFGKQSLGEQTA